jgi:hypothetical protein
VYSYPGNLTREGYSSAKGLFGAGEQAIFCENEELVKIGPKTLDILFGGWYIYLRR